MSDVTKETIYIIVEEDHVIIRNHEEEAKFESCDETGILAKLDEFLKKILDAQ